MYSPGCFQLIPNTIVHEGNRFQTSVSGEKQPGKWPLGGTAKKMYRRRRYSHTQVPYVWWSHLVRMIRVTALNSHVEVLLHYCLNVFSWEESTKYNTVDSLHRGETRDHQSQRQTGVVQPNEMHPATFPFQVCCFHKSEPQRFQNCFSPFHQSETISEYRYQDLFSLKSVGSARVFNINADAEPNSREDLLCYWPLYLQGESH